VVGGGDAFISRYSFDLLAGDGRPERIRFAPKLNVAPGSLQLSAAAQILGIDGGVSINFSGGAFAQYCVSSTAGCGCVASTIHHAGDEHLFGRVRLRAPASATGYAGHQCRHHHRRRRGFAQFVVATGSGLNACSLDVDGNGSINALTDGLMLMRADVRTDRHGGDQQRGRYRSAAFDLGADSAVSERELRTRASRRSHESVSDPLPLAAARCAQVGYVPGSSTLLSTSLMFVLPQNAIVSRAPCGMISRHFVTPSSPIAPRP
jgi:hypothetical protein